MSIRTESVFFVYEVRKVCLVNRFIGLSGKEDGCGNE